MVYYLHSALCKFSWFESKSFAETTSDSLGMKKPTNAKITKANTKLKNGPASVTRLRSRAGLLPIHISFPHLKADYS